MCARYSLATPVAVLRALFGFEVLPNLVPRYNIAPTQVTPIVRVDVGGGRNELVQLRWGLIPSWAKDAAIGHRLINARAETVAEKPAFREAFRRRRCLVPADGFYEWRASRNDGKEPWRVTLESGAPFAFAGLWEQWRDPTGEIVATFTIITTDASAAIADIHPRMPVILDSKDYDAWLAGPVEVAATLLVPYEGVLTAYRVSTRINSVRAEGADLLAPAPDSEASTPVQGRLF